jgi:hypothetical protein
MFTYWHERLTILRGQGGSDLWEPGRAARGGRCHACDEGVMLMMQWRWRVWGWRVWVGKVGEGKERRFGAAGNVCCFVYDGTHGPRKFLDLLLRAEANQNSRRTGLLFTLDQPSYLPLTLLFTSYSQPTLLLSTNPLTLDQPSYSRPNPLTLDQLSYSRPTLLLSTNPHRHVLAI